MTEPTLQPTRWMWPAAAAVLLALGLLPADASAGTYVVHSCRLANGAPTGAAGWKSRLSGFGTFADNSCERGGALSAGFSTFGDHPNPQVDWYFPAPKDLVVQRVTYWRYARVHYSSANGSVEASNYWTGPGDADATSVTGSQDVCLSQAGCRERGRLSSDPFDPANRADTERRGGDPSYEIHGEPNALHLNCGRSGGRPGCPSWTTPRLIIYAARITMRDDFAPRVSGLNGALFAAGDLREEASAEVFAEDRGAGLRSAAIEVDGRNVLEERFQPRPRPCHEPFSNPRPCALAGSHGLRLDTRRLADGAHQVRISGA